MKALVRKNYDGGTDVLLVETEAPTYEARIAIGLIEKWGIVALEPSGEDSTGRQQFKPKSLNDVVKQAFDTAELAVKEMRARGLVIDVPLPIMPSPD